jgi:hypothetical protein
MPHTTLHYLYRDAANYKVHGHLLLLGACTPDLEARIRAKLLASSDWFIPEQIGIPPLQGALYALSQGPTVDDLSFHELLALRPATPEEILTVPLWGTVADLDFQFAQVVAWDPDLAR